MINVMFIGAGIVVLGVLAGLWLNERLKNIALAQSNLDSLRTVSVDTAKHHASSMTQAIRDLELLREAHKDNTRLEQECLALSQECYTAGLLDRVNRAMQALNRDQGERDLMKALTEMRRSIGTPPEPVLRVVPKPTTPPEGDKS